MLFTITGKHVHITEAIKKHAEEKTAKLPRYYSSINQAEVIIDGSRKGNVDIEVIARAEHGHDGLSTAAGEDAQLHRALLQVDHILGSVTLSEHHCPSPVGADRSGHT